MLRPSPADSIESGRPHFRFPLLHSSDGCAGDSGPEPEADVDGEGEGEGEGEATPSPATDCGAAGSGAVSAMLASGTVAAMSARSPGLGTSACAPSLGTSSGGELEGGAVDSWLAGGGSGRALGRASIESTRAPSDCAFGVMVSAAVASSGRTACRGQASGARVR